MPTDLEKENHALKQTLWMSMHLLSCLPDTLVPPDHPVWGVARKLLGETYLEGPICDDDVFWTETL